MRATADRAVDHTDAKTQSVPEDDGTPSQPNATADESAGADTRSVDHVSGGNLEHLRDRAARWRKWRRGAKARKASDSNFDEGEEGTGRGDASVDEDPEDTQSGTVKRRIDWYRVLIFGVLPGLALLLALGAAFFKWQATSIQEADTARIESVSTAEDATVAVLSYQSDSAEQALVAARERTTGEFKDAYTQLTQSLVIPGAKQQNVSVDAKVVGAASVSASPTHAVVLVFVNQTSVVGSDKPTELASTIRVTMEKVDGRWLISDFEPI